METKWESINGQEITIGMFIIVKYWNLGGEIQEINQSLGIHQSLGKVIQANKNSFTIQEIGISKKHIPHCIESMTLNISKTDISERDILYRFTTFNSKRRRQITKDGKYISPSREVVGIFRINPTILKFIGEKVISQENEEMTRVKNELTVIKKKKKATKARMKNLGL